MATAETKVDGRLQLTIDQSDCLMIVNGGDGVLKVRTNDSDMPDLCWLADKGLLTREIKRGGWHVFRMTEAGKHQHNWWEK